MRSIFSGFIASSLLLLAACGGGGGGGSTPPPNPPPPQAQSITFANAGPVSRPLSDGTYTNVASGGAGTGTISYQSSNTAVATVNGLGLVTFVAAGSTTITANKAADAGFLAASANYTLTITAPPPTTPVITLNSVQVTPGTTVTASAISTDPQGGALTYAWDFGDGTSAAGATASHVFTGEGSFSIRVTVTNPQGVSSTSTAVMTVAWRPMVPPALIVQSAQHLLGDVMFGRFGMVEPNGLAYTAAWDFGDGSTATGETAKHQYSATGNYTVRLTITNSAGRSVSSQKLVEVRPVVAQPAPVDNTLQVYCAGAYCGAQNPTTYSGSGVGVWRYHNATNADATINVAISGLRVGQSGFLVFSNGNDFAAASVPVPGTALHPGGTASMKAQPRESVAHAQIQAGNRAMLESLANKPRPTLQKVPRTAPVMQAAAPPVGTTRVWRDIYNGSVDYNIQVAATCTFTTGRNGVVWSDVDQVQRGEIDPLRVQMVADYLCGANGVYERLVAMHGDVYGDATSAMTTFIQDASGNLQDLNVVILGVPQATTWNGYFSSANLVSAAQDPNSNHALSVVLNGWYLGITGDQDPTTRITLAHEIKHLLNFYQRGVRRSVYHSVALEETSAMLAEELMGAEFGMYSRTESRISSYPYSGGGVGYLEWTDPDGQSYALGGSLGSFLHRRYGPDIDTYLMDTCSDNGFPSSSYQCLNAYIVGKGGVSFADEFARVGATSLGRMGLVTPKGFGYRGAFAGTHALWPVSCGAYEASLTPPRSLGGVYRATSQTYDFDFMDAAQTSFVRNNVVVPAGTTLMVVVNDVVP